MKTSLNNAAIQPLSVAEIEHVAGGVGAIASGRPPLESVEVYGGPIKVAFPSGEILRPVTSIRIR
jgi:hypothetical protein